MLTRSVPESIKLFLLVVFIVLFYLEFALRLQQKLGPLWDLEMSAVSLDSLSDTLNHRNSPRCLSNPHSQYNGYGVKMTKRFLESSVKESFRVLFMGDSFMEGFNERHSVPNHIMKTIEESPLSQRSFCPLNAGTASYSPVILIAQAKEIIPKLKPDFVVIDIDETDIGDDYFRYKSLIVRDENGSIVAVKQTPVNSEFLKGMIKIRKRTLYLTRAVLKFYHTRVYISLLLRKWRKEHGEFKFAYYSKEEIANSGDITDFFEQNIDELAQTLISLMKDKKRILFVTHPHLDQIAANKEGRMMLPLVSSIVRKVTSKYQIGFYDASQDLKDEFGDEAFEYYVPHDIHFNYKGIRAFGQRVGKKVVPMIGAVVIPTS